MKKALKKTFIIIGATIIFIILVLGYLGFMPGVSWLMGSATPRDLGIKYTEKDLKSAYAKVNGNFIDLPASSSPIDSLIFSGSANINSQLSNEEMTALANSGKWIYRPTKDVQIRVNNDGTVEASGILVKKNLAKMAEAYGYSGDDIKKMDNAIAAVPGNPRFYVKGTASITNNNVNLNVQEAEIGRINAKTIVSESQAESIIEQGIKHVPNANIRSASFGNGELKLDATLPSQLSRAVE